MKTAMIRKALLPVLAASAVMVSTPALAQNFGVTLSFGSPGYSQGYGNSYGYGNGYGAQRHGVRQLQYRAHALSRHIDRLAWAGAVDRREARSLSYQMNQYRRAEYAYARNGLSAREYHDLDRRLDRIEYQVRRTQHVRW